MKLRVTYARVDEENEVAVVALAAKTLDADNARVLRDGLHDVVARTHQVVLDLAELELVDSSGLGAILCCLRDVTGDGGDLKVCGLAPAVRAVFDLVRLHRVLDIHRAADDAVAAFG